MRWWYDTARSSSCTTLPTPAGNDGSSCVKTVSVDARRGIELREHGFDHPARRAIALDDDHHTIRQHRSVSPRSFILASTTAHMRT